MLDAPSYDPETSNSTDELKLNEENAQNIANHINNLMSL